MAKKKLHTVKVIARKNGPLGLQWGQEAEVPATDYVEHLIETGSLEWVQDSPVETTKAQARRRRPASVEEVFLAAALEDHRTDTEREADEQAAAARAELGLDAPSYLTSEE